MHVAFDSGKTDIIKTFLEWMEKNLGTKTFNKLKLATDKNNKTVLDYCLESDSEECYEDVITILQRNRFHYA